MLVHDKDAWVREIVADQGRNRDLDILVFDPNPWVRMKVALQCRDKDLILLADDPNEGVREATAYIQKHLKLKQQKEEKK